MKKVKVPNPLLVKAQKMYQVAAYLTAKADALVAQANVARLAAAAA